MESLKEELRQELKTFRQKTMQFIDGEMSVKDYKGYSGGFGSYAQRNKEGFMLRLRMNQGCITKDKMKFICDTMAKYDVARSHLTTCQTVQLHDLQGEVLPDIMDAALDHDIVTRGGGGDFPRNVMASPLSGCDPEETFDVIPYAHAVGDYLLSIVNKYSLPRKLKVSFSNTERNETHANFRDLGFIAKANHTFDVYCCGGLGNNPRMGVKVAEDVDPKDLLYYVHTMVLLFMEHGNYTNRAKARTRYLQETLGQERLVEEFNEKVLLAKEAMDLDLQVEEKSTTKTGEEELPEQNRVFAQKQPGLYAVSYHPMGGMLSLEKWQELYDVIADMEDVEVRISPQEELWIVNCTAQEAKEVLAHTQDGAQTSFERSVACIGAATCQVGLRDSQSVLQHTLEACKPYHFAEGVLPRIFISGCPSSCGTNQIGQLGFQGFVKRVDNKVQPAFKVSLNGNDHLHATQFGQDLGVILESEMGDFFVELGQKVTEAEMTFSTYIEKEADQWNDLVEKYMG